MKVTGPQVRAAMKLSGGNVTKAAEVLGIARNNLYKRLMSLEIDPAEFRGNSDTVPPETPGAIRDAFPGEAGAAAFSGSAHRAPVSSLPSSVHGRRARTFPLVMPNQATATIEPPPAPQRLRPARTIYLRREQFQALDDACFDLAAALRERFSLSKVMERFIDERFADWLAETKKAPTKRSARKGGEKA